MFWIYCYKKFKEFISYYAFICFNRKTLKHAVRNNHILIIKISLIYV